MGSEESKEVKTVDSTGAVNNNVVIQEPVPIHNDQMTFILLVICVIKIIELLLFCYKVHLRRMKKRYLKSNIDLS